MDETERYLVINTIASIIDSPSIYIGGPSTASKRKAENIIHELERGMRLVPTTCDHSERDYKLHGICCPRCGTLLQEQQHGK